LVLEEKRRRLGNRPKRFLTTRDVHGRETPEEKKRLTPKGFLCPLGKKAQVSETKKKNGFRQVGKRGKKRTYAKSLSNEKKIWVSN